MATIVPQVIRADHKKMTKLTKTFDFDGELSSYGI